MYQKRQRKLFEDQPVQVFHCSRAQHDFLECRPRTVAIYRNKTPADDHDLGRVYKCYHAGNAQARKSAPCTVVMQEHRWLTCFSTAQALVGLSIGESEGIVRATSSSLGVQVMIKTFWLTGPGRRECRDRSGHRR